MATPVAKSSDELIKDWWVDFEVDERMHKRGCPMNDGRLEFMITKATTGPLRGREVAVIRCCDCGEQDEVLSPTEER
jgi:hypothetical protein